MTHESLEEVTSLRVNGKEVLKAQTKYTGQFTRDISAGDIATFVVGWHAKEGFYCHIEFPESINYRLLEGSMA